jgi:hypothetical protein
MPQSLYHRSLTASFRRFLRFDLLQLRLALVSHVRELLGTRDRAGGKNVLHLSSLA